MANLAEISRTRPDLRSICVDDETWQQAKELAKADKRSVSSFFRSLVFKSYQRKIKKAAEQLVNVQ